MEELLFLLCVVRSHSEACLTGKHLTSTGVYRKQGGFSKPQECGVVEAVFAGEVARSLQYQYKSFLSRRRPDS